MSDVASAVVAAWKARLKAAGLRAYDEVPENRVYPYFAVSHVQVIPLDDECSSGSEIYLSFNGWGDVADLSSIAPSAALARAALTSPLAVEGHTVVLHDPPTALFTKDPATGHAQAAMMLRLETEPV